MMFDHTCSCPVLPNVCVSNATHMHNAVSMLWTFCWGPTCCCGPCWVCHLQLAHHALQGLVGLGVQGPAVQHHIKQQQQQWLRGSSRCSNSLSALAGNLELHWPCGQDNSPCHKACGGGEVLQAPVLAAGLHLHVQANIQSQLLSTDAAMHNTYHADQPSPWGLCNACMSG
jgi:hypothetical protein